MHSKLQEALRLLDISSIDYAKALFTYLDIAGYLSDALLDKVVTYLSVAKVFMADPETVKLSLKKTCNAARSSGRLNIDQFLDFFAREDFFTVPDIIDLITFLQQTAFDRKFGEERDRLRAKPWMEESANDFIQLATQLGIVAAAQPSTKNYAGIGIMGAASRRTRTRVEYYLQLRAQGAIAIGNVWALSGNRELSKGLDEDEVMADIAKTFEKPLTFVKKPVGLDTRDFLDGVTETMMVNYFIHKFCPEVAVVDSAKEKDHWRATTKQNAMDLAPIVIDRILRNEIKPDADGVFRFMIIAEQPYPGRMARQVQRAFNAELAKRKLDIKFHVEGCGAGIALEVFLDAKSRLEVFTRMNSELGSLMAERFNDARLLMALKQIVLRDPSFIMFDKRDGKYQEYLASRSSAPTISSTIMRP